MLWRVANLDQTSAQGLGPIDQGGGLVAEAEAVVAAGAGDSRQFGVGLHQSGHHDGIVAHAFHRALQVSPGCFEDDALGLERLARVVERRVRVHQHRERTSRHFLQGLFGLPLRLPRPHQLHRPEDHQSRDRRGHRRRRDEPAPVPPSRSDQHPPQPRRLDGDGLAPQVSPQVLRHRRHRLVPPRRVRVDRRVHDAVEVSRDVRHERRQPRRDAVHHSLEQVRHRPFAGIVGGPAREEFVEHRTHREDVRPRVDGPRGVARRLLGAHVRQRAHQVPPRHAREGAGRVEGAGHAEVEHLGLAGGVIDDEMRRLEVAVDHGRPVRVLHALARLEEELDGRPRVEVPLPRARRDGRADHELHHEVRAASLLALMDPRLDVPRDVGVVQFRQRRGFELEPPPQVRRHHARPHQLHRHPPLTTCRGRGAIHVAHRPRPQQRVHFPRPNHRPRRKPLGPPQRVGHGRLFQKLAYPRRCAHDRADAGRHGVRFGQTCDRRGLFGRREVQHLLGDPERGGIDHVPLG